MLSYAFVRMVHGSKRRSVRLWEGSLPVLRTAEAGLRQFKQSKQREDRKEERVGGTSVPPLPLLLPHSYCAG